MSMFLNEAQGPSIAQQDLDLPEIRPQTLLLDAADMRWALGLRRHYAARFFVLFFARA